MFKKKRKSTIKVDLIDKKGKKLINSVELYGSREDLFRATANIVTGLIISGHLSIEDVVLAFESGIEDTKKIVKNNKYK